MKRITLTLSIVALLAASLHAAAPVVSNLSASQRAGTKLVDIVYDVSADTPTVEVSLEVSSNLGSSYITSATSFSGAIGADVAVGTGKTITWDAGADWNEQSSSYMRIKIIATEIDPPIPADMALIPAGSFQKGDSFHSNVETVSVDEFYVGKYEVTKSKWDEVYNFNTDDWHGIGSVRITDNSGNFLRYESWGHDQPADEPVYGMHVQQMAIWCNKLSVMEGRIPCYTQNGEPYRVYEGTPIAPILCDYNANGYRLPTSDEWEKAARGGLSGKIFPWGDQISHETANFYESQYPTGYVQFRPDGDYRGHHNSFDTTGGTSRHGLSVYTSPVGSFAPNGYGLYDVAGNVLDTTWDCEGTRYVQGVQYRGGDFNDYSSSCTVSYYPLYNDVHNNSWVTSSLWGFRLVVGGDAPKQTSAYSPNFTVNTISAKMPVLSLESYYESNSGESVTIDATPTDGYPTNYSYQWYFNGVAIQAASGGISNSYSIDGINSNDGTWKVEVTNDTGTTTAEFEYRALIETVPVLNIGAFYESNSGESITIDATPTDGYPTNFTYQWSFNNALISPSFGGASSTLLLTGSSFDNGTWKVQVTNDTGVTSAEFEYRVFADADGDGLSDYRESNLTNTNPDLEDSDSDGLNDYAEVITHNTDPNESDSDDDGLSDGAEITTHSSDPNDSDSDVDGLSDGAEVNTHSTDPKVSDSDGDGLSDGAEVNTHGTNPNASDSDADGLSDADEITTHSTDPNLADSDSDGLSDGTEINTHSSDPLASDSSGDGLSDGYVVSVGFDPNTNYTGILEGSEGMTQDLRIGAEIASVANGEATLQIVLEESDDLTSWSHRETVDLVVPLQAGETTKFFRYAMQGAPSDDGEAPAVPDGFALIPGGSFQMGDALDGDSDAPVVTVAVSAFYMGQYEVTKAEWDEVRTWGLSNGYTDLPSGGGKAADHPVHSINWYAMVKWCNARSEMEGRTPCYTVSGSTYRTGSSDGVVCDWTATGYRLPTEAEWEKAARGGATGQRFPWGATISHANANYRGDGDRYSYDANPFTDLRYHPDYDSGDTPYTSAVGSFAANGYGLYDMAGNVWEWCWDWYASSSYSDGAADPRGAASGSIRVLRGGSWINYANSCRVADRSVNDPSNSFSYFGFRVALSSVPQ